MAAKRATMTVAEAKALTERIRLNLTEAAELVRQAYEGKVWVALGYSGFREWMEKAVGVSGARGYQLLYIAATVEALKGLVPLPEFYVLSDRQIRAIKTYGREMFFAEVRDACGSDEVENAQIVERLIVGIRAAQEEKRASKVIDPEQIDPDVSALNVLNALHTHALIGLTEAVDVIKETEARGEIASSLRESLTLIDTVLCSYRERLAEEVAA